MQTDLAAYIVAVTLLTLTPGVDTLLVIRNSSRGGFKDGVVSSLGICTGLFVHAGVSGLGISVILLKSAWAFMALKTAGAVYLVGLGIVSLSHAWKKTPAETGPARQWQRRSLNSRRSFAEGFLSNVLNPKAVIFYMAFLPQFINPSRPAWVQALGLAGIHFIIAMVWQSILAAGTGRARRLVTAAGPRRLFEGLTGVLFMVIGARLLGVKQ